MLDYTCEYPDGRRVLVSQMTTQDIKICLGVPNLEIFDTSTQSAVRKRLGIELLIRQMGLRKRVRLPKLRSQKYFNR